MSNAAYVGQLRTSENCKYLCLIYCAQDTEISVKHSLLLGKFVYYNQVLSEGSISIILEPIQANRRSI